MESNDQQPPLDGRAESSDAEEDHCHSDDKEARGEEGVQKKLLLACSLVLLFMIAEFVGCVLSNSLAIITDGFHLLSDLAGFLISLFAVWVGSRPATKSMSFGYHRAQVLGATASVLLIWVLTGILVYMAILRLIHRDYTIDADIMLVTAACGVVVNIVLGAVLHQSGVPHSHGHSNNHSHGEHDEIRESVEADASVHGLFSQPDVNYTDVNDGSANDLTSRDKENEDHKNINVRAAFIHVLGDLVQSVGVLIAATIIKIQPTWIIADPICTFMFSILVLFTTVTILKDAIRILMEGKPSGYEYDKVKEALMEIREVKTVHDLHLWSLSMGKVALTAHLTVGPESDHEKILREANHKLKSKFDFHLTTVQVERHIPKMDDCKNCEPPSK